MSSIITFYSYKGGVGRTMALANIAVLLSRWGKKVLMVDWDLEAPGLEHFFFAGRKLNSVQRSRGLVDVLHSRDSANEWRQFIIQVEQPGTASLAMLTAGARNDGYFRSIQDLDVRSFYERRNGGYLIESLRSAWKFEFDFVLVDSRTGITDIGGVCTIQLPDILALIFTATEQSLAGAVAVARKAATERQKLPFDRPLVPTVPIPSKFDTQTEREVAQRWLDRFVKETAWMYHSWLSKDVNHREFLELTKIPYSSYFSFGEGLPVIEQGTTDPTGLGFAYETVAAVIGNELQYADVLLGNRDEFIAFARRTTALPRVPLRETSKPIVALLDCAAASLLRTPLTQATNVNNKDDQLLARYEALVAKSGREYDADILMSDGDRVLFGFGAIEQAIRCCLEIQEQLLITHPLVSRVGVLRVRAAIHTPQQDRQMNGIEATFGVAARALRIAKDGQIVMSANAQKLLPKGIEDVRLVPLKESLEIPSTIGDIQSERLFEVVGLTVIELTAAERVALLQQDPRTKSLGGFQAFLVGLQKKLHQGSNRLTLTVKDRERIARYAHDYRGGGWQARLRKIFGRTLGLGLGREP